MGMEISITQAKAAIIDVLQAGLVPILTGSPGLGKSDIIRTIAKEKNLEVIDFRLAQADPTDLMGFPTLNADRTRSHYAAPSTFPLEDDPLPEGKDGWLLFFDEMNAAPMSVQAASYKVILDRMIGEKYLHKNVAMVCAGNKTTDKAITNRLSTAMQSRMIHLNLKVDSKAWFNWATANDIDYRIIGFLRFKEDLLHKFDPSHADDTFPCPRTWHFMSKIIKDKPELKPSDLPVLVGTVGQGPAMEFKGFTEIYQSLPTVQQMLSSPASVTIPTEPSTLYAITSLIGNKATKENIDKFMVLINRLNVEFQVITLQNIIQKDKAFVKQPSVKAWISANANELLSNEED